MTTDLESLEFQKKFDTCLNKFRNSQILLNKISQISTDNHAILLGKSASLITSLKSFIVQAPEVF